MDAERFLLKWNNHQSNLVTVFDQLYEQEAFTDVTLACDGRSFAAHKVILSACSPYFQQLFLSNPCKHPIIFMRDVRAADLDALLAFMYRGEINVHQQDLASFLKTAESLQIKGLSDSSDKPRDTSKILEAMEKKFSTGSSSSANAMANIGTLIGNALSRSSPISSNAVPSNTSSSGMNNNNNNNNNNTFGRSLLSHVTSNHSIDNSGGGPPEKKFKPTPEEFTRILPKIKSLVSSQSLMSPVPGLITPITLAATVMKTGAHPTLPLPYIPPLENNNTSTPSHNNSDGGSPLKERKKEGYISGDAPHPVYLVSSVGGLGLNSSGNSTPSHEVKVEEEDPLEENAFSDDPTSLGNDGSNDDHTLGNTFGQDKENYETLKNLIRCEIITDDDYKVKMDPQSIYEPRTKIPVEAVESVLPFQEQSMQHLGKHLQPSDEQGNESSISLEENETVDEIEYTLELPTSHARPLYSDSDYTLELPTSHTQTPDSDSELPTLQSEIKQENSSDFWNVYVSNSVTQKGEGSTTETKSPCLETNSITSVRKSILNDPLYTDREELEIAKSVVNTMEKSGDDLQKNPEFLNCLLQEVKIKLNQEKLIKERPVDMIGLRDHSYTVPFSTRKNSKVTSNYECQHCRKTFAWNRRHLYLSHLAVHSGEKPFRCVVCKRGFRRKDHLKNHTRLHTGEKPFFCVRCNASFSRKRSLSVHKCFVSRHNE